MHDDRLERVTRHTAEVVTEEELAAALEEENPSVYIGYAPTGEMHIGHFTTIRKLVDFLEAGLDVTVLIADLHAHLDDEKSPFELLDARSEYYRVAIEGMVEAAGGEPQAITFVRGTDFELEEPYTLELFRMAAETTANRARRAASEVIRETESPALGGLLYPLMQTQDVAALDADIAYGGVDQRGIYMLSREVLPNRGYEKPVCCFAPLLSGLTGEKMSASEADSTIAVTDDADAVREKIEGAYCPAGEREDNGVLEYLKYLVFPVLEHGGRTLTIHRPDEYGGNLEYDTYAPLEADFLERDLHPADLKPAAGDAIADVIGPIRERLLDRPDLLAEAYPNSWAS